MIKLIVSDIDGTLIPYGASGLSPRLFPLIRRLLDRGILFCPASGRQFHSLRLLFAPLSPALPMMAENGAVVFGPGETEENCPILGKTPMPRQDALAIAEEILASQYDLTMAGANTCYVVNGEFGRAVQTYTGNHTVLISRPQDIQEDIFKVSAYSEERREEAYAQLSPRWGGRYSVAFAGGGWVDTTFADKGLGLDILCRAYGVAPGDVAAFGDNYNDLSMLQKAGHAYLMDSAAPELKAQVPNHCTDVCDILEEILDNL